MIRFATHFRGSARGPVVATLILLLLAGCNAPPTIVAPLTPSYRPANVHQIDRLPIDLQRVVLLPVWSNAPLPDTSLHPIDEAFQTALIHSARFEVVTVTRAQMRQWFKTESLTTTGLLPANLFATLRERTAADAVFFVDLTHFNAYPPLAMGFRCRLVRLNDGVDLWAVDELIDAGDAATAAGARRFYRRGASAPADMSPTILQNPARFAAYAADALASSLPAR